MILNKQVELELAVASAMVGHDENHFFADRSSLVGTVADVLAGIRRAGYRVVPAPRRNRRPSRREPLWPPMPGDRR